MLLPFSLMQHIYHALHTTILHLLQVEQRVYAVSFTGATIKFLLYTKSHTRITPLPILLGNFPMFFTAWMNCIHYILGAFCMEIASKVIYDNTALSVSVRFYTIKA